MNRLFIAPAACLLGCLSLFAQSTHNGDLSVLGNFSAANATSSKPVPVVSIDPSGACGNASAVELSSASLNLFACISGSWQAIGNPVSSNSVLTTGSYSDPVWLTHLAAAKLTGTVPTGNLPVGSTSAQGILQAGSGLSVTSGTASVAYGTGANQALQGSTLGQPNGPAQLNGTGSIPGAQLPVATSSVQGIASAGTGLQASSGTLSVAYGSSAGTAVQGSTLGAVSGIATLDGNSRLVQAATSVQLASTGSLGTCSATVNLGAIYFIPSSPTAQFQACTQTSSSTYGWVPLGASATSGSNGSSTYQYLDAAVGTEIFVNDQYLGRNGMANTGKFVTGDTFACAWSDNGNEYCTYNDGTGVATSTSAPGTNVGLIQVQMGGTPAITEINTMSGFGTESQLNTNGWTDNATWKTAGIGAAGGALYMAVQRQLAASPNTMSNASLIKSVDHGVTWCNYTHATLAGCSTSNANGDPPTSGQSMWPSGLVGPTLVTYCQDNSSCQVVDGNDKYYYLTSLGTGQTNLYVLRILKADLPLLDATKYQYYTAANGNGVVDPGNWSSSSSAAQPVLSVTSTKSQVFYVAALKQYIFLDDSYHGSFNVWNAATLGGPWVKSAIIPTGDENGNFPTLLMDTVTTLSASPPTVTVKLQYGGDYTTAGAGAAFPASDNYSLHYKNVTLTGTNTPAVTSTATSYSNSLSKASMALDYAFLPELTPTVTDYSGGAHNGTISGKITYAKSPSVLWLNEENSNPVGQSVNSNYAFNGSDFTIYAVFRHMQAQISGECIFSNGSNLSLCRSGATPDSYTLNVGGTTGAVNTVTDGSWNILVIRRSGAAVNVYDGRSFAGTVTPITTISNSTAITASNIVLGGSFSGQLARFTFYTAALSDAQMIANESSMRTELSAKAVYVPAQLSAGTYPLDTQPPYAAYSIRRLLNAYTGASMQVKRTSDNTTQDVGFTSGGDLDTTALMSFCAGTTCNVTKWYDQSGSHYDLAPVTGTSTIVNAGTMITGGTTGKPCINFANSNMWAASSFGYYGLTAGASVVGTLNLGSSGSAPSMLSLLNKGDETGASAGTDVADWLPLLGNGINYNWHRQTSSGPGVAVPANKLSAIFSTIDGYLHRFGVDGTYVAGQSLPFSGAYVANERVQVDDLSIGGATFVGGLSEVIFWPYQPAYAVEKVLGINQFTYFGTNATY